MMLLCTYELGNDIICRVKKAVSAGNCWLKQVKRTLSRITNLGGLRVMARVMARYQLGGRNSRQ